MNNEIVALGKRVTADKHFRWVPGMRYRDPAWPDEWESGRVRDPHPMAGVTSPAREAQARLLASSSTMLPDLSDAATLGCVAFNLLPAAWGHPGDVANVRIMWSSQGEWALIVPGSEPWTSRVILLNVVDPDAFGEALVVALESAP